MTGLIFLVVISIIVLYASGYVTQLYEVFKSFFKSFYYFLCEWLKDKLYKKHIRYTKRLRYNFPSGMTYATEFDSNWYIKEIIRNDTTNDE